MASIYRVTWGFGGPTGWSETHAALNTSDNPADLMPTCVSLAQKRAAMLGREWYINAIRISKYSDVAGNRVRGHILNKVNFANPNQTVAWVGEPYPVAYQVLGTATPPTPPTVLVNLNNDHFLGGPLDATITSAGLVDTSQNNLLANFQSWSNLMVQSNFGWLSFQELLNLDLLLITQNTDGTVSLTTDGAVTPPTDVGETYPARIRQVNQGSSPLNGEVLVTVQDDGSLKTKERIAFKLAQSGGAIRIYANVAIFVDYAAMTLGAYTIKHKRGRPFGLPAGRAKKRIRA